MTEPRRGRTGASRRGWWVERGSLVVSVVATVVSAADHGGSSLWRSAFVGASFATAGLVGLAWYRDEVTTREVLFFAVLFRLIAFPLLPSLSDDGFRYVWDGWIQTYGINPYLLRPSDAALASFQESELYVSLNSANYYSVYPPSSQWIFILGGLAVGKGWIAGWFIIKASLLVLELGGVWALSRLASSRALLLYAWHPLVVIEVAGQAHTEAGMVGLVLMAVMAYQLERPALSVATLTAAGWFKLYPLALLPFLLRRVGWRHGWVAAVVSLLLLLPYATSSAFEHVTESLDLYVRLFEFNAGPYYALKEIAFAWSGEDWSKTLGPALRGLFLIGLAVLYRLDYRRRWPLPWVWLVAVGLLWATATTVHPWYLVGVLALLPLTLQPSADRAVALHAVAWLWLALASLGTYLLYTNGEGVYWVAVTLGWGGWAVALAVAASYRLGPALMRHRADQKWHWLRSHLGEPGCLLDLGAGEGFVGAAAARETGADVTLADIVDFNQTALPLVRYDGRHLPFPDDSFDTTLLVYVLHHSEDPLAVLHEARRVTTERVGILESVVENRLDRRWLPFADRLANRVRSGGRMRDQEDHLHFGTVAEWRAQFAAAGFEIVTEERRGRWLHKRHLFILA